MGESIDGVRSGVEMITQAMKEHGRDTTALIVQGSIPLSKNSDDKFDLSATLQNVPALIDAGATAAHLPLQRFCAGIDDAPQFFSDIRRKFDEVVS
jgi:hypothetical protein